MEISREQTEAAARLRRSLKVCDRLVEQAEIRNDGLARKTSSPKENASSIGEIPFESARMGKATIAQPARQSFAYPRLPPHSLVGFAPHESKRMPTAEVTLRTNSRQGLIVAVVAFVFLVLAYGVASGAAGNAADNSSRSRMTDRGSDRCPAGSADPSADESSVFARRGTCCNRCGQCNRAY
jgi:hypothetical protein